MENVVADTKLKCVGDNSETVIRVTWLLQRSVIIITSSASINQLIFIYLFIYLPTTIQNTKWQAVAQPTGQRGKVPGPPRNEVKIWPIIVCNATRVGLQLFTLNGRDVTCYTGSHSVTCHLTQVNAPRLTPAMQAGTRFTYPEGMEGW